MAVIGYWDFKNNYTWAYYGARPVYHFSDYFKLQGEIGVNTVKPDGQVDREAGQDHDRPDAGGRSRLLDPPGTAFLLHLCQVERSSP